MNVLPSLSGSSIYDKKVKTALLCDTLTLVGIRGYEKGKFQPQPNKEDQKSFREIPETFQGNEKLSEDEINILADLEDEFSRKGGFSRIYPLAANISFY